MKKTYKNSYNHIMILLIQDNNNNNIANHIQTHNYIVIVIDSNSLLIHT